MEQDNKKPVVVFDRNNLVREKVEINPKTGRQIINGVEQVTESHENTKQGTESTSE